MKGFFHRLSSFVKGSYPLFLFCLVVSNFILSCSANRAARPVYKYHHVVITNEVVTVVSNSPLVSVSSDISVPGNYKLKANSRLPEIRRPYKFFLLDGCAMALLDGFYYRAGDVLSSGTIIRIFPDCIFLHDGSRIMNTRSYPERKELLKDD